MVSKKFIVVLAILLAIFSVACVSAAEAADDSNHTEILADGSSGEVDSSNYTVVTTKETKKPAPAKLKVKCSNGLSKYKKNKYFKVKVTNKKTKKPVKNLKLKLKVKLSKGKYKTYSLKTDKNGVAKFSMKKLKPGVHKASVSIKNKKYESYSGFDYIHIWKTKKTTYLKMNKDKKVDGDYISAFYETHKNRQNPPGAYVGGDMSNEHPKIVLLKAKFFFKNKKTGNIKSKTTTSQTMSVKLIKGYKPVGVKVWYGTLK